jgi:hypothetical protein
MNAQQKTSPRRRGLMVFAAILGACAALCLGTIALTPFISARQEAQRNAKARSEPAPQRLLLFANKLGYTPESVLSERTDSTRGETPPGGHFRSYTVVFQSPLSGADYARILSGENCVDLTPRGTTAYARTWMPDVVITPTTSRDGSNMAFDCTLADRVELKADISIWLWGEDKTSRVSVAGKPITSNVIMLTVTWYLKDYP